MNLLLTSYRIPNPNILPELLKKDISNSSVGLITNARDYYSKRAKQVKISDSVDYFNSLGFKKINTIDLNLYKNKNSQLQKRLAQLNFVWMLGGNTYCLMESIDDSGFEAVARKLAKENNVLIGGTSAGAIAAGNSTDGAQSADNPLFASREILKGMGLIDAIIIPHADNPEFEDSINKMREVHKKSKTIELNDNQMLIQKNSKISIT
jgi:dipeptidase E